MMNPREDPREEEEEVQPAMPWMIQQQQQHPVLVVPRHMEFFHPTEKRWIPVLAVDLQQTQQQQILLPPHAEGGAAQQQQVNPLPPEDRGRLYNNNSVPATFLRELPPQQMPPPPSLPVLLLGGGDVQQLRLAQAAETANATAQPPYTVPFPPALSSYAPSIPVIMDDPPRPKMVSDLLKEFPILINIWKQPRRVVEVLRRAFHGQVCRSQTAAWAKDEIRSIQDEIRSIQNATERALQYLHGTYKHLNEALAVTDQRLEKKLRKIDTEIANVVLLRNVLEVQENRINVSDINKHLSSGKDDARRRCKKDKLAIEARFGSPEVVAEAIQFCQTLLTSMVCTMEYLPTIVRGSSKIDCITTPIDNTKWRSAPYFLAALLHTFIDREVSSIWGMLDLAKFVGLTSVQDYEQISISDKVGLLRFASLLDLRNYYPNYMKDWVLMQQAGVYSTEVLPGKFDTCWGGGATKDDDDDDDDDGPMNPTTAATTDLLQYQEDNVVDAYFKATYGYYFLQPNNCLTLHSLRKDLLYKETDTTMAHRIEEAVISGGQRFLLPDTSGFEGAHVYNVVGHHDATNNNQAPSGAEDSFGVTKKDSYLGGNAVGFSHVALPDLQSRWIGMDWDAMTMEEKKAEAKLHLYDDVDRFKEHMDDSMARFWAEEKDEGEKKTST